MVTDATRGHIVKRFDDEMLHLNQLVLEMGGLVVDQIGRAVHALEQRDPAAAREVVERDGLVNDLDVKLDEEIVMLLTRRHPVASDLRDVMTVAKTVTDLERAGDQTRKVALLVERLYENGNPYPNVRLLRDITSMADEAASMLRQSLDSFEHTDVDKALAVIHRDRQIEEQFQDALRRLTTYVMQDSRNVGHAVEVVLGLRALERIGGHAKNIAGYVIYLVTGKDVRHEDLETIEAKVLPLAE